MQDFEDYKKTRSYDHLAELKSLITYTSHIRVL